MICNTKLAPSFYEVWLKLILRKSFLRTSCGDLLISYRNEFLSISPSLVVHLISDFPRKSDFDGELMSCEQSRERGTEVCLDSDRCAVTSTRGGRGNREWTGVQTLNRHRERGEQCAVQIQLPEVMQVRPGPWATVFSEMVMWLEVTQASW